MSVVDGDGTESRPGALRGLRVVDWAQGFAAPLCARLLGDLGAEVIKVEPPEGDWTRAAGIFTALNYNKRGIMVNAAAPAQRERLLGLLRDADVLIENHAPGYLDALGLGYEALAAVNPGIVVTSVTPFGQTGPRRHWLGEDLIACHAGGLAMLVPDWVPDASVPPLRPAPRQAEAQAALNAAIGTIAAVLGRDRATAGEIRGVHVDVSVQECVAAILHSSLPEFIALGRPRNRLKPTIVFAGFTRAKDGYVRIVCVTEQHWQKLGEVIGAPELVQARNRHDRYARRAEIEARTEQWASQYTMQEIYHLGQRLRLPWAPLNAPSRARSEPQFRKRNAFITLDQPGVGPLMLPGAPFKSAVTPWRVYRAAPALGAGDGVTWTDEARVMPAPGSPGDAGLTSESSAREDAPDGKPRPSPASASAPLSGVRVADFSWAWAGPHCAIQLADMGAEVIKVESRTRMDSARTVGPYRHDEPADPNKSLRFTQFNRGKAGVTANLREPEGLALAHRLVETSDIVIENFAPGVMDRLGLGYAQLSALRSDLIMLSLSGFGQTGPERDYVAYGYTIEAFAGLGELTGQIDGPPLALGLPYADPAGGLMGAVAVLAALRHRELSGEGQHIDLSEAETLLTCLTEGYAVLAETGSDPARSGNADRIWSPHGVYACRDGRWLALSVMTDEQWQSLRQLIGSPDWSGAAGLATAAGRVSARRELDAALAAWTADQNAADLAERMQAAGVPATMTQHAGDLLSDPHLAARGFFQQVDHPGMGVRAVHSAPYRFGANPFPIRRAAPLLGEDNDAVLGDLLGVSRATLARYATRGLLD